jgi:hypothetical protein
VLAGLLAAAGACATQPKLMPASRYTSPAHGPSLAVESRGGVTVTSDGRGWDGAPANLPAEVTPVWVTVHNTTGQPVRVQYDEFALRGPKGDMYEALAPYTMDAPASTPAFRVANGGYFENFAIAPYLAPSYPWMPIWDGPLPRGPSYQSVAAVSGLPTAAMLQRALPEGVLENDGTASGFLYFQKIGAKNGEVRFLAVFEQPTEAGQPRHALSSIDIKFRRVTRRWPSVPFSHRNEGTASYGVM